MTFWAQEGLFSLQKIERAVSQPGHSRPVGMADDAARAQGPALIMVGLFRVE